MELAVAAVITGILLAVLRTPIRYQDLPPAAPEQPGNEARSHCADPASEPPDPQV
jgi:hypothetical protein